MGGIIATEHISLDGVVEAPGPGDIGDHPHKGWVFDFEPGETGERYKLDEALAAEFRLLGRVTHETMAAFWPGFDGRSRTAQRDAEVRALDHARAPDWTDSTILRGDLVTEVTRLA
jgi:hypothetical protein